MARGTDMHVKLTALKPTQMAVGYAEVAVKRAAWRQRTAENAQRFLKRHRFPVVRGPKGAHYMLDHHHLGRALMEEGVSHVWVQVLCNLEHLKRDEFWIVMDYNRWVHPYDAQGRHCDFADIPSRLDRLPDDPYRSLAAEVRRTGEYPKSPTPFAEFLWADFFRHRIPASLLAKHPRKALQRADKLARAEAASHLPGWLGLA